MANGWTDARRAQQAKAIRQWRPWEHSTGPRTVGGKARVARNAYRGGQQQKDRALVTALNGLIRDQRAGLEKLGR
jgi:hypothetical protein